MWEKVIAIFCSDLHLSLNPPIWRSNEPDWLAAQQRPIDELKALQDKYECPIFCAGDLFNRWNSSAELINWAMKHLPYMYTIPGQHDLPEHDLTQIHRSAYWTLVEASVIHDLSKLPIPKPKGFEFFAFPYGTQITRCPLSNEDINTCGIALIHEYHWIEGFKYENAPTSNKLTLNHPIHNLRYNWIVSGDNHNPFQFHRFWNCGCFIRRRSDEILYLPRVGLLLKTGGIVSHRLDISKDKHLTKFRSKYLPLELDDEGFTADLEALESKIVDFQEALHRYVRNHPVSKPIEKEILKALPDEPTK